MSRTSLLLLSGLSLLLVIGLLIINILLHSQSMPQLTHAGCVGEQTAQTSAENGAQSMCRGRLLIFSKTAGYRHDSIKDGIEALKKLALEHNITADFTEEATIFTPEHLKPYQAVIFLMTSGDILNGEQQQAFEAFIRAGGGYAGVHSASDTEYDWPWYGKLVGAYFKDHPQMTQATLDVVDRTHPSTSHLSAQWRRVDEWYNFRTNPRLNVHVLMTVDETTYHGGKMGGDHPIAWYHEFEGGRSWYTALGHTAESYRDPLFLSHLWGGIVYAAGFKE